MPLIETLNKIRREQDTIKEQIFQEFAQGLEMIDRAKQKEEERQLREREKLEETAITYENGKKITTKKTVGGDVYTIREDTIKKFYDPNTYEEVKAKYDKGNWVDTTSGNAIPENYVDSTELSKKISDQKYQERLRIETAKKLKKQKEEELKPLKKKINSVKDEIFDLEGNIELQEDILRTGNHREKSKAKKVLKNAKRKLAIKREALQKLQQEIGNNEVDEPQKTASEEVPTSREIEKPVDKQQAVNTGNTIIRVNSRKELKLMGTIDKSIELMTKRRNISDRTRKKLIDKPILELIKLQTDVDMPIDELNALSPEQKVALYSKLGIIDNEELSRMQQEQKAKLFMILGIDNGKE